MNLIIAKGLLIPFLGTSLGAACVIFLKGSLNIKVQKGLTGFAAGVMVAASVWSLIIPAMDQSAHMGKLSFLPAFIGLWAGFIMMFGLDKIIPHLHRTVYTKALHCDNLPVFRQSIWPHRPWCRVRDSPIS